jgi:hypothetical protein
MFVNNSTGQRGLVCQYDVVCFDEISGVSFDQKDGVNIMKGYMESGEFSRGRESIRAFGSIVMLGNFEVDVEHQQRVGHLFGPLPPEMRNDTAFMDRIHAYIPGWDVPKMEKSLFTTHFGMVSDFLSECFAQLRNENRLAALQGRVIYGGALSGRDTNAVNHTINGLLKLLYPNREMAISDEDLEWAISLAMECRRRVKVGAVMGGSPETPGRQDPFNACPSGVVIEHARRRHPKGAFDRQVEETVNGKGFMITSRSTVDLSSPGPRHATSRSARGFLAAINNSVRAAPDGALRPCSHSCRVRTDTPSNSANRDCERPVFSRTRAIEGTLMTRPSWPRLSCRRPFRISTPTLRLELDIGLRVYVIAVLR